MSGRLAQFNQPHTTMPDDWKPQWNIAPGKPLLILRKTAGQLECASVLWNLTPGWLKDLSRASFSARAEYLHEKPMFRQAFACFDGLPALAHCISGAPQGSAWRAEGRGCPFVHGEGERNI